MQKIARITSENWTQFTHGQRAEISERVALRFVLKTATQELRDARRQSKGAEKIASIVCSRIESPRSLNKTAHLNKGNETMKTGKRLPLAKVVANVNAMTTKERRLSEGNHDAFVHRRIVQRKAINLSRHEREEVLGVVREVLLSIPFEGKRVTLAHWKAIFRQVRETLGVQRIMSRMESIQALEEAGTMTPDMAIGQIIDGIEAREITRERRDAVCAKLRQDHSCLLAAYRVSSSRKALAVFRGFVAFSLVAAKAALGEGHGMATYKTAWHLSKRYQDQVAWGKTLLDCPTHQALPSVDSICDAMFARHQSEKSELQNRIEGLEMFAIQS